MEEVLEVKPRLTAIRRGGGAQYCSLFRPLFQPKVVVTALYCEKKLMCTAALYDPIDTQVKSKLGWSEKMLPCRAPPIPLAS
jgi:hypothetical protein